MSATADQCKVARLGDRYSIDVDARLRRKRERDDTSLRDLENYLGGVVLRQAMEDVGMEFVESDPERYYSLLTNDEASRLESTQVRRRLQQEGVDVDQVLSDVPSYQSIRHHLSDCLGDDTSGDKGQSTSPERVVDTVRALQTRTERVVEGSLADLREQPDGDAKTLDCHVAITVMCSRCGVSRGVVEMVEAGCDCRL